MKTPKEKANDLIELFKKHQPFCADRTFRNNAAKQCALVCCDECIKMLEGLHKPEYILFDIYEPKQYFMEGEDYFNGYVMHTYLEQVKNEIENYE